MIDDINIVEIPIDSIEKDFQEFLNMEGNKRILFSGRFGIGKTYFLNTFFQKNKEEYDVFHLYPINYQISRNEDILELIKYNVLLELLNRNAFTENDKSNFGEIFFSWIKDKLTINSALQSILSAGEILDLFGIPFSRLGRPLKDLLVSDSVLQEFEKEYKKGEKGVVEKYIKEIEKNGLSETDYLSELIKDKIKIIKDKRKSVLIVDDLDRMDPEHIFRILNIFSAYFEQERNNKFGFDYVIFVADFNNLKEIFHHRFGKGTDERGYFDKFYSIEPYIFDNEKALIDAVDNTIDRIKKNEPNLDKAVGGSGVIRIFLTNVFIESIKSKKLNLRELLKAVNFQLRSLDEGVYSEDPFSDNNRKLINISIETLISILSGEDNLVETLEIIKKSERKTRNPFYNIWIESMLKSMKKLPELIRHQISYGDYFITLSEEGLKITGGSEEDFFYELMIDYIKLKKYKERNYDD